MTGCDEAAAIEDADHVGKLMNLDDAPRPIWHAVVVAADRDEAFMADAAFELEQRIEGHGGQRLQVELFRSEGLRDDLLRRGMQTDIGDVAEPVLQLRVQIVEIPEGARQEEVLADIAEGPLDLSLIRHDDFGALTSLPLHGGVALW